jgi:hypothetical protein
MQTWTRPARRTLAPSHPHRRTGGSPGAESDARQRRQRWAQRFGDRGGHRRGRGGRLGGSSSWSSTSTRQRHRRPAPEFSTRRPRRVRHNASCSPLPPRTSSLLNLMFEGLPYCAEYTGSNMPSTACGRRADTFASGRRKHLACAFSPRCRSLLTRPVPRISILE